MDERTTVQVPVPSPPSSLVTQVASGPLPYHVPLTVTPFNGLCLASCAVIRTVADQVVSPGTSLLAKPSRFPTWACGGFTSMEIARALLPELASACCCVAVRMCPHVPAPAVFQLNVRVALAPMTRPGIVCVPRTALPAVPS